MSLHPIFSTRGEHVAYFGKGYVFSRNGEWIGFVDARTAQLFAVNGEHVGYMSRDGRLLRKRTMSDPAPRRPPPPPPPRPDLPSNVPLPPMYSELGFETVDIMDEMPYVLSTPDADDLRPDMD
jgi:hypothetical protein